MACTERIQGAKGVCYAVRLSPNEDADRRRIRLGKVTRKQADTARAHIEQLVACRRTGSVMPPATQQWVADMDFKTRTTLEEIGLVSASLPGGAKIKVLEWCDSYIAKRTDVKPNTISNMRQAYNHLVTFLEGDFPLASFTAGHAADFRLFLIKQRMAEATVRRHCKRIKQFFAAAISYEYIKNNPFDDVPISDVANKKRRVLVDHATFQRVLDVCSDDQWRLIFVLARYGGLRIPSEIRWLRWDNLNWTDKRFVFRSPKTEHIEGRESRDVPLFPELIPYFRAWEKHREHGEPLVFPKLGKRSNLRAQARRIIERAGIKPWPRLFQNLRASRCTDLSRQGYSDFTRTAWIGHNIEVDETNYLMVDPEDYERAASEPTVSRGTYLGQTTDASDCQTLKPNTEGGS